MTSWDEDAASDLGPGSESPGESRFVPLWRRNEAKSLKTGARSAIYWVEKNPKYEAHVREGKIGVAKPARFRTGDSYAGEWLHNKKHGFGTSTTTSGRKYQGDFKDGKRHGMGTLWMTQQGELKKEYTGQWQYNKRHGLGIHYDDDGNKYEGHWAVGKKAGRGKLFFANGDQYEGDFADGQRSGIGVLTLVNGDRFEGHWEQDKKEGPGRFFFASTRKVLQAEWADDVARAGVFSRWPDDVADDANAPSADPTQTFKLPELGLEDDKDVLNDAFNQVRRNTGKPGNASNNDDCGHHGADGAGRAAAAHPSAATTRASPTFSDAELQEIRAAFKAEAGDVDEADGAEGAAIYGHQVATVLNTMSIFPTDSEIMQLLMRVNAGLDTIFHVDAFTQILQDFVHSRTATVAATS